MAVFNEGFSTLKEERTSTVIGWRVCSEEAARVNMLSELLPGSCRCLMPVYDVRCESVYVSQVIRGESNFEGILRTPVSSRALQRELFEETVGIRRRKSEYKRRKDICERQELAIKSKEKLERRKVVDFKEPNAHTMDIYFKKINDRIQSESIFDEICFSHFSHDSLFEDVEIASEALFDGVSNKVRETTISFVEFVIEMLGPIKEKFGAVLDIFRPLAEYIYLLYRSRNVADVLVATDLYGQLLCAKYPSIWISLKEKFLENIYDIPALLGMRAESFSDTISEYRALLANVLSSELVQTIRNLTLSLVSLKWFSKDVSKSIISYVGKPDKMSVAELFSNIIDQFLVMMRVGESLVSGVPFHTCLVAKNPISQFVDESALLLYYQDKLYRGLPVEGMMCHRKFINDVDKLIQVGEALIKNSSPFAVMMNKCKEKILLLRQAVFEVKQLANSSSRQVPFGVVLHGDPGVGKGRLLPFIASLWSRVKGRGYDDSHIFHRTCMSEYWEGYQPFSHPFIHYSEVGGMHPDLAKCKGDVLATEVCSLMDSLPFFPNMAFSGKGLVAAQPELVLVDTNNPGFNLDVLVTNKSAHQRRFLFIEAIVKPEYVIDGSTSLDPEKSFASPDGRMMNRWVFKVYYYKVMSVKKSEKIYLMHGRVEDDIFALVKILQSSFVKHISNQNEVEFRSTKIDIDDYLNIEDEKMLSEMEYQPMPEFSTVNDEEKFIDNMFVTERGDMEVLPRDVRTVIASYGERRGPFERIMHIGRQLHGNYVRELANQSWIWLGMISNSLWHMVLTLCIYLFLILLPDPTMSFPKRIGVFVVLCVSYFSATVLVWILPLLLMIGLMYSHFVTRLILQYIRERVRGRLRRNYEWFLHLIGFNVNYNPFETQWWRNNRPYAIAMSVFLTSFAIIYMVDRRGKKKRKCDLDDYMNAESSTVKEVEEDMQCGRSSVRIATKDHAIWNTMQIVVPAASYTGSSESLSRIFERNSRQVQVILSDGTATTYLFGICGNFCVINTHALGHGESVKLRVSNIGVDKDMNRVWYDTLLTSRDRIDLGDDVSLIRVKSTQFRDVRPHLISEFLPQRTVSGYFDNASVRVNALVIGAYHMIAKTGDYFVEKLFKYESPDHDFGFCGKPLYMDAPGGSILAGIHTGGKGPYGYSVALNRILIEDGMRTLEKESAFVPLVSEGPIFAELELVEPIPKSPVRFISVQGLNYYGKIKSVPSLPNGKSKLQNTKLGDKIRDLFYEQFEFVPSTVFGKPMMAPSMIDGQYISPYNVVLSKLSTQRGTLDGIILEKCIKEYVARIVGMLKGRGVESLNPLSLEVAINGDDRDAFLRRINVTTAAGFGFSGKKSQYLSVEQQDPLIRVSTAELTDKILKMYTHYEEEKSYALIFNVALKDEARDFTKIRSGKTRPFYVIPLEGLVVSRMLLSPLYTSMVQYGDIFGTAVGINIVSSADSFLERLLDRSNLFMEGDYGNFDQRMPFDIGWAAYSVIYRVLEQMGYNESALRNLRGLITSLLFPYMTICGDLFGVPGLQPSGMYGTAENNSLRGVLMLMYAFYSNPKLRSMSFFDCVTPVTYGDDVLATVNYDIEDEFNNLTYAKFCDSVYKLEYTSAAKNGILTKFVTEEKCTFLKRNFVYRADLGFTTALLSLDSVIKSLEWFIPSGIITIEEQMKATLVSALWEIATRTDEYCYNIVRAKLVKMIADRFSQGELFDTPSWGEIISRIKPC